MNLIERLVTEMGSRWNPATSTEVGVDGYIELFEPGTRKATGLHLSVQSKAPTRLKSNDDRITYSCRRDDIAYWLTVTPAAILVVSQPDTAEAYWLSVSAYFGVPENQGKTVAVFDRRTQRLTSQSYNALLDVARPKARAVTRTPDVASEVLYSNLIPLRSFPPTLYVGEAIHATYAQAWACLREGADGYPSPAWLLHEKSVMSFVDLAQGVHTKLIEKGTLERHNTAEWSNTDDSDRRRLFVQLLNRALRDDLGAIGIRFFEKEGIYAFKGKLDEPPRTYTYSSLRERSTMTVVHHYVARSKKGVDYPVLRHEAFHGRFRCLGGAWYLEVTPTYRFTSDGSNKYLFHEEKLKGIKRIEGNRAVLSQVLLWNDVLRSQQPSLFSKRRQMLSFDRACDFRVNVGIPDAEWVSSSEPDDDSSAQLLLPVSGKGVEARP